MPSTSRATRRSRRSWARRRSRSTRSRRATPRSTEAASAATDRARACSPSTRRPRSRPARSSRTRTPTRPCSGSSPGSRKGSCWHEWDPHLRSPLRGGVQQELPRRGLRGREAGRRDRRRGRGDRRRRRRPVGRLPRRARQVRRDQGLPREGAGGPRAAGRRRDGEGHSGPGLHVRAVRRRPARVRDRRRRGRPPERRRDHGGDRGQGAGRQARRRPPDPAGLGDRGRRLRRRARRDHRPPQRVRDPRVGRRHGSGRGRRPRAVAVVDQGDDGPARRAARRRREHRGRRHPRRRRPWSRQGRGLPALRGARRGARRRGCRHARGGRRRLVPVRGPDRPDRQDGGAEAVPRGRHLGRDPAQGRHAVEREHRRDQQGPERADLRVLRPRRRRRPEQDPAEADRCGEGEEGELGTMAVAPIEYPPPVDSAKEYVGAPTDPEDERIEVGVAIVGGGPAGLACAIRLMQLLENDEKLAESLGEVPVALVEKGKTTGSHLLSGAMMKPSAMQKLFPDLPEEDWPTYGPVPKDTVYLLPNRKWAIPLKPTPPPFRNHGNHVTSVAQLGRWLAQQAEDGGVYILGETAGAKLLVEDGRVVGVRSGDKGRGRDGEELSNFEPGSDLIAKATVLCEGTQGHLTGAAIRHFELGSEDPQQWELGVKEVWEVQKPLDRVIHTMGWPLRFGAKYREFGGSFIYPMGEDRVSMGLVVGLDYRDATFSVHDALQQLKSHPLVAGLIDGGKRVG